MLLNILKILIFKKEQINNMNTKSLEQAFLTDISTIRDAIISLSKSTLQICVLVDKDKRIIGTITDGDIRRSLLHGKNLNNSAFEIANKNPIVVNSSVSLSKIKQIMKQKKFINSQL